LWLTKKKKKRKEEREREEEEDEKKSGMQNCSRQRTLAANITKYSRGRTGSARGLRIQTKIKT
jgi:hypothetical protein